MKQLTTSELMEQLANCWTVNDVAEAFSVTTMTVHNWRAQRGLPTVLMQGDARPAVRFVPADVLKWARDNRVPVRGSGRALATARRWSSEEDRLLAQARGRLTNEEIGVLLQRSGNAVHGRAHRLGLTE